MRYVVKSGEQYWTGQYWGVRIFAWRDEAFVFDDNDEELKYYRSTDGYQTAKEWAEATVSKLDTNARVVRLTKKGGGE
jgi:hypothetical protein